MTDVAVAPVAPALPDSTALAAERTTAEATLTTLRGFTIDSIERKTAFAAALADVQSRWKKLDDREKQITRPALQSIESTRELFRGPKAAYAALEACIKEKLGEYDTRCALEVGAATERAQALAAAGDAEGAQAALMAAGEASDDASEADAPGMQVRHPWAWEIINIDLLDRQYILPNAKAITAEMRRQIAANETPVIPGVKFHRTTQIAGAPSKKGAK